MCFIGNGDAWLSSTTVPFSGVVGSVVAWVYRGALAGNAGGTVAALGQVANINAQLKLDLSTTSRSIRAQVINDAGNTRIATVTPTDSIYQGWHMLAGVFTSTSLRDVYVFGDRVSGMYETGQNTTAAGTTTSFTRMTIGGEIKAAGGSNTAAAARLSIGHVSFWDRALSWADLVQMSRGVSPLHVKGAPPVYYFPLIETPICIRTGLELVKETTTPGTTLLPEFSKKWNPPVNVLYARQPKRRVGIVSAAPPPSSNQRINRTMMYS